MGTIYFQLSSLSNNAPCNQAPRTTNQEIGSSDGRDLYYTARSGVAHVQPMKRVSSAASVRSLDNIEERLIHVRGDDQMFKVL